MDGRAFPFGVEVKEHQTLPSTEPEGRGKAAA